MWYFSWILGVGLVERVDDHAHVSVRGDVALPARA